MPGVKERERQMVFLFPLRLASRTFQNKEKPGPMKIRKKENRGIFSKQLLFGSTIKVSKLRYFHSRYLRLRSSIVKKQRVTIPNNYHGYTIFYF